MMLLVCDVVAEDDTEVVAVLETVLDALADKDDVTVELTVVVAVADCVDVSEDVTLVVAVADIVDDCELVALVVADVVTEPDTVVVTVLLCVEVADDVALADAVLDTLVVADEDTELVTVLLTLLEAVDDTVDVAEDVREDVALALALVVAVDDSEDVALDVIVVVAVVCASQSRKDPERYLVMATFISDTVLLHAADAWSAIRKPPMVQEAVPSVSENPLVWSTRPTIVLMPPATPAQFELLPPNLSTLSPSSVSHATPSPGRLLSQSGSSTFSSATWSSQRPSLRMYCVPLFARHDSLPWNELVTVLDAVDVMVVTTIVDVAVVVSVV